jgi:hypothetical protein
MLHMRTCSICHHAKRREIDQELTRGTPMRSIATRFHCKPDPLRRHRKHIAKLIVRRDRDLGGTLLQQMMQLTQRLEVMFQTARGTGDFSAMGAVIEAQRKMLLSQHELITSAPVQQRPVRITVKYEHSEIVQLKKELLEQGMAYDLVRQTISDKLITKYFPEQAALTTNIKPGEA